MAKSTGLGDGLLVSGYDVSGDVGSISSIQGTFGEQDGTSIEMPARDRIQLIENGSFAFNNFFNDSDGEGAEARGLHDILTADTPGPRATHLISYHRGRAVGAWVANLEALRFSYSLARTQSGSLLGTVNANSTGALERAIFWSRSLTPFVADPHPEPPTGVLTLGAQPEAGDQITIGSATYTFAAALTTAGEIAVGATLPEAVTNIVAAINGTDSENSPNADVEATGGTGTVTLTALVAGAASLAIGTVYTHDDGSENSFAAATLTGDPTASYPAFELGAASFRAWFHVLEFDGTDAVVKVQDSANGTDGWADLLTLWDSDADSAPAAGFADYLIDDAEDYLRVVVETTDGFTTLRFAASVHAL